MSNARRSALASIMRRAHRAARRMRALFATYREALAYALRCVYRAADALAFLTANEGRQMFARFVKADGSVRRMRFLFNADKARATSGTITVLDMDKSETRRINLDTQAPAPAQRAPAQRAPAQRAAVDVTAYDADVDAMTDEELDAHAQALFG
jgi:hypothetical protein